MTLNTFGVAEILVPIACIMNYSASDAPTPGHQSIMLAPHVVREMFGEGVAEAPSGGLRQVYENQHDAMAIQPGLVSIETAPMGDVQEHAEVGIKILRGRIILLDPRHGRLQRSG